jgi:hypothetical protein
MAFILFLALAMFAIRSIISAPCDIDPSALSYRLITDEDSINLLVLQPA